MQRYEDQAHCYYYLKLGAYAVRVINKLLTDSSSGNSSSSGSSGDDDGSSSSSVHRIVALGGYWCVLFEFILSSYHHRNTFYEYYHIYRHKNGQREHGLLSMLNGKSDRLRVIVLGQ